MIGALCGQQRAQFSICEESRRATRQNNPRIALGNIKVLAIGSGVLHPPFAEAERSRECSQFPRALWAGDIRQHMVHPITPAYPGWQPVARRSRRVEYDCHGYAFTRPAR